MRRTRFQKSVDAMDRNAWDADGRWRLSTYAKTDFAFWNTILEGWVGWVAMLIAGASLAVILYWVL